MVAPWLRHRTIQIYSMIHEIIFELCLLAKILVCVLRLIEIALGENIVNVIFIGALQLKISKSDGS